MTLNSHIASVHEGKKPFKCDICNASFTKTGNLNRHVASIHERKKPFYAKISSDSFSSKEHLNEHFVTVPEFKSEPLEAKPNDEDTDPLLV